MSPERAAESTAHRGDVAAVEARLWPEFLHFEGGQGTTRQDELDQLRKRKPGVMYIASRTWEHERVRIHADSRVHRQGERAPGRRSRSLSPLAGQTVYGLGRTAPAWGLST
jgi:hypothetical protein